MSTVCPPNPVTAYLKTLKPSSRRAQQQALKAIAEILGTSIPSRHTFPWSDLTPDQISHLCQVLIKRYAPATVSRFLSGFRQVLKFAHRDGYISDAQYAHQCHVLDVFAPMPGQRQLAGRYLTAIEIDLMLDACRLDRTASGYRDAAIIVLLRTTGIQRRVLAALQLEDYNTISHVVRVRWEVRRPYTVTVENRAAQLAMLDWLLVRGDQPGALFCPINKAGRLDPRSMTPDRLYRIVVERARQAQIDDVSPQDFRLTYCLDRLRAGADVREVAQLMGYASTQQMKLYYREASQTKKVTTGLYISQTRRN